MATKSKTTQKKAADKEQARLADMSDGEKANQNTVVTNKDEKDDLANAAHAKVQGDPVGTVVNVGEADVGPRTYEEAQERAVSTDGTVPDDQTMVVNPSNYEEAVEAADNS